MKELPPITIHCSFADILGEKGTDIDAAVRRERWEEWKSLASANGEEGKEVVDYWCGDNVNEGCAGCKHRDGDWCKSFGLPCTVNRILTFRHAIIGMACMGTGYEAEIS